MHKKTSLHLSNSVHYKKTPLNKGKKCTVKLVHNEHEYNELTDITKCFGAPVKFAKNLFLIMLYFTSTTISRVLGKLASL